MIHNRSPVAVPPALALVAFGLAACAPAADSSEAGGTPTYVAERTGAPDDVRVTIRAGALWSGASLREELALGVEAGPDPYMFGSISAAWVTPARLYVVDEQIPIVRAFDRDGTHLFDVGTAGQGPGEYQSPSGLAADDERIYIADPYGARVSLFDHSGEFVEAWPMQAQKSALGLTLGDSGLLVQSWSVDAERMGIQGVGPDGVIGEIRLPPAVAAEPRTIDVQKGLAIIAPFSPQTAWTFGPRGDLVAGAGHSYELLIEHLDGRRKHVTRYWEPVRVIEPEAEYRAALATREMRRMFPGVTVSAADIPATKPALESFHADRAGRLWVRRLGVGQPDPACISASTAPAPNLLMTTESGARVAVQGKGDLPAELDYDGPCWIDSVQFDLYDLTTGDFLTTIAAPEAGFGVPLYADADTVLAAVTDDLGTVRLKQYRLVRADDS